MPKSALILDLDDTLVDTSKLSGLRDNRKWDECIKRLSETTIYPGVLEAITALRNSKIPIGIVTSSVSKYAIPVLKHHDIPYDALIAWHDCSPRKPDPAPVIKCLEKLGCITEGSLGVGDLIKDAQAYKRAGITAWGAGWCSSLHRDAEWDEIIDIPDLIVSFFQDR